MSESTVEVLERELEKHYRDRGQTFLRVGGDNVSVDIAAFARSIAGQKSINELRLKTRMQVPSGAAEKLYVGLADFGVTEKGVDAKRGI